MKKFIFSISAVSMAILTACSGNNVASPTDETDALSDMTIIAETTGVYMGENGNNENSGPSADHDMKTLKEKFPEYFDLGTFKGLEIYVWQMAEGQYSFGIMQGTNRNKTDEELMDLKGATTEEMKAILSTYEIEEDDIFIIPWQNPISSYIPDYLIEERMGNSAATHKDQYIEQIRNMLFGDISEEVYTASHTVSGELTAVEIYYETWPSVPETDWEVNSFNSVDTTTNAPIDTASTENTDEYNIQIMQLTDDVSADIAINVVWSRSYSWAMGRDYVYVDSEGKIYEEHEMEEPMFKSLGACNETYSGEQFTEEELDEFLSINKDDEDLQKEILRRKGIKFGK